MGFTTGAVLPAHPAGDARLWTAFAVIVGALLTVGAAYASRSSAPARSRRDRRIASDVEVAAQNDRRRPGGVATAEVHGDVAELRDLTDRHRSFFQIVAHDLKNPINAIYLTSDRLLSGGPLDPTTRTAIARIREMAAGADAMIFDLVNLFRVIAKRETATWVALGEVVGQAITTLRDPIDRKDIGIEIAPDLPVVWGHPDKIHSVLVNLLSNAVKYVPRGVGRIRLSAGEESGTHLLAIEDNGVGIPVEYRERIFELFARLPDPHQEIDGARAGGTGVGLALVRGIMDLHHGSVVLEAASPRGSRFELRFPKGTPPIAT